MYQKKIFQNGSFFEGESDGLSSKQKGKFFNQFRDYYVGEKLNKSYQGAGKITYESGEYLEGIWEKGKISGKWRYGSPNGIIIEEEFRNENYSGEGNLIYKENNGKYMQANQNEFVGEGKGIILFPDGRIYEGQYSNKKLSGFGKFIDKFGDYYIGSFQDNMPEGNGRKIYIRDNDNLSYYEGSWKKGKEYGHGTYFFNDGSYIEGDWNEFEKGKGIKVFKNGRMYEGEFQGYTIQR